MNDQIGQLIAGSNPVASNNRRLSRDLTSAESELCEAIMSLPILTPVDQAPADDPKAALPAVDARDRRRYGHRRRWALIGSGAVAAAAATVALLLVGGPHSNVAVAEWVTSPQPVTAEDRAAIVSACQEGGEPEFDLSPLDDQAVIDRRGSIAALMTIDGESRFTCAAHFYDGRWYSFGTSFDTGGDASRPALTRSWNTSGAELNVVGGVAPGAASVEVDAPGLATATATVVDGRYIVWLPYSFDWTEIGASVHLRYLDESGQVLQSLDFPDATSTDSAD